MNAPINATENINKLETTNGFLLPILSAMGPDNSDPMKYPKYILDVYYLYKPEILRDFPQIPICSTQFPK